MTAGSLARGRELFAAGKWAECFEVLSAAEEAAPLPANDVALLAQSAYLIGRESDCIAISERGYQRMLAEGEFRVAARAAFWLAFTLLNRRELARGSGWAARVEELVEHHQLGGAEEGLLLSMRAHGLVQRGETAAAIETAERALRLGAQAEDADVVLLARLSLVWARVLEGDRDRARAECDQVLVAISAGETSPAVVGLAYCAVISACMQLRDLGRAQEWTSALTAWCDSRPDLVAYRGECLVHRAQIFTLHGRWTPAAAEAEKALAVLPEHLLGAALYARGELYRLRGRFAEAEDAYRRANAMGRRPEPGLARLRIAQGRPGAAVTSQRRICAEPVAPEERAELLAAQVEALLAVGDPAAARECAAELARVAGGVDAPLLAGLAAHCTGATRLATGEVAEGLTALRRATAVWRDLGLPHHLAQARVLVGQGLRDLGDEDAAEMEFGAAREAFETLGAAPDLAALDSLDPPVEPARPGGLTAREVEVIRLVARGLSNRAVADHLRLSEKTVARHLSNIYTKLGISSRAAATAYAYEHELL
jgi:DNA-binding CsgD family transcriptional regulator